MPTANPREKPAHVTQTRAFRPGLGLGFKISAAIIILISIVMGLVTWVVRERVQDTLLAQMRLKGLALTRGLAANAAEALITADRLLLSELVDKAVKQEDGINFVALVDEEGVILAHSNYQQEGQRYTLPPDFSHEQLQTGRLSYYTLDGEPCLDFALPILLEEMGIGLKKKLGTAHVVYLLSPIRQIVNTTLRDIFYIAAGGLALGILFALFLVKRITRPIARLAGAAHKIGAGNLDLSLKITSRDELGQLASTFNLMTANLKKAQAELIVKERLQHEMELARQIQTLLVPKKSPTLPGYSIGMLYRAAQEVSGDYFDFIELGHGQWGIVMADVSGKGIPGGLVMAQTRATLRTVAPASTSPRETLSKTQRQLDQDIREDMFITLSYLVLDVAKKQLCLARAGHLGALVYRQALGRCEMEMPAGIAIGIADPDTFERKLSEKTIKLHPGDFIFLYTDGIDEASDEANQLFGLNRLVKCLVASASLRAEKIITRVEQAVRAFAGNAPQNDDMTMIVIKIEK